MFGVNRTDEVYINEREERCAQDATQRDQQTESIKKEFKKL